MPEPDDIKLLREYAVHHSEGAFAAVVEKYVNLVYSTALRSAGNVQAAEEISQAVFIILARKAGSLRAKTVLSGWLYQTTRLTAANFLRGEIRRQRREQESHMQSLLNESSTDAEAWRQIAPLLDEAMGRLSDRDRNAIVLRFFENKSLREVGAALDASEDAAKQRVGRALEKLREFFNRRGISTTTAIVSGAISASSVHAAPPALAGTICAVAVAKGATVSGSTLTLVKGVLKIMAWTKMKTAAMTGAALILATGTTTLIVHHHQRLQPKPQLIAPTETDFPKTSWVLAGYADPQSALLSAIWSLSAGDLETFLASLTPSQREIQLQQLNRAAKKAGKSLAAYFTLISTTQGDMPKTKGFCILDQQIISDDQVILRINIQGTGPGKEQQVVEAKMIKTGNEWKVDSMGPK
jgi:RNA polymerase sigma factor (sigma-70 family)